ncbi:MAG: GHKL domain-containing protein [Clostridia bacterium]
MKKVFAGSKWLLIPLWAWIVALMLGLLASYTQVEECTLYLTPIFEDARGWDIYQMEEGTRMALAPRELLDVKPLQTFYLTRTLTKDILSGGYTFVRLDSDRPASVFLNDELLYTTCPDVPQRIGQITFPARYAGLAQRGEAIRFSLPQDALGKVMTIATAHPASEYGPSMPSVQLSSEAIEARTWMNTANHSSMPAAGFAVATLVLLGLLFYGLFHGGRNGPLLLLAATAFCDFFYYLRKYSFSSPGLTVLDTPWAAFLPMLSIMLPEFYLLVQMKRWRAHALMVVLASGALSLIPPVANLFGSPSFHTTPFVEALYIGLMALLVFAALEAREKNKALQLFLYGLGGGCASLVLGVLISMRGDRSFAEAVFFLARQVAQHDPLPFLHACGIFLFALASALSVYQLICGVADTQTQLAVQTERSARLDYEMAIQKEIYEAKLSGEKELRALRHDIKGHLATLSELLAVGETEKATTYLAELTKRHQAVQSEVFCDNPYMNAVLRTYQFKFKESEIPFVCHAGVDSQTLPGVELCLVLTNALENALEASLGQIGAARLVKLQARIWHGQFLLRVSNRFDGTLNERGGLPVSTKEGKGHGFGMANIRATVQRLGGAMDYRIEDGCFVMDVRFPAQEAP